MSKKLRLAWFPFFAETWLYDEPVQELSPPERDAYLTLLCLQWRDGSLPFDCIRMVTKLPGKVDPQAAIRVLEAFFPPDPDTNRRRNPKLADLQRDSEYLYTKKQEKMRALARKRWEVKTQAVAQQEVNASRIAGRIQHIHLPIPSPTEKGMGEPASVSRLGAPSDGAAGRGGVSA